jgi:hypothetical protein
MTDLPLPLRTAGSREDVLVSVCFGNLTADEAAFATIEALARELDARFRFREIIVLPEESQKDAFLPLVQRVENLRLLTVRDGTDFYRRRAIAAEEAIGDVVLLANAAELAFIDPVDMIARAADLQSLVLAIRSAGIADHMLAAPLATLGRIAGFKVGLRQLQTLALPRTLLNQLLAHPDPDLALRFPPRDVRVPLCFAEPLSDRIVPREGGQLLERAALLHKLLVYVAPSILVFVTLTSALLLLLGLGYAFYVLGAWLLLDNLAPGWLTLSTMLSMTAFFLGVSIMGLSLGLQQLLAQTRRKGQDGAVDEINRIDLFGQVASELNVDLERGRADPPVGR